MNIIFQVHGGLGKSIASTAFVKKIKQKYPKSNLIVVTPWLDVFLENPYVDEVLHVSKMTGFYKTHVEGNRNMYILQDPYLTTEHINQEQHLLQSWFSMIGEKYNGELPELYFDIKEQQYYAQQYQTPKPLFVIHPNGGSPNSKNDKYNWARDMPPNVVQQVIDHYKDDYTVAVVRTKDQIKYNNCVDLVEKWREVAIALKYAKKRLLIDSSFQHIAAAMNLPSVVLWNVTDPAIFGYDLHTNIKANPHNKEVEVNGIYHKYNIDEPLQTMPYHSFNDVYNVSDIIKVLGE